MLATLPSVNNMERKERLTSMYDAHAAKIYAYALRHRGPNEADDVVAEVFAIAAKRVDVVPEAALPWLVLTARNVMNNGRRAADRRRALIANLSHLSGARAESPDDIVSERDAMLTALDQLSWREREALLLVSWDGLSSADAASVARCSQRAFKARLARARVRIAASLLEPEDAPLLVTSSCTSPEGTSA